MGYLLRYNDVDLDFGSNIYVVNWDGAGFEDIISTVPLIGDGSEVIGEHHAERQIIINIRVFNERQKQRIYEIFTGRENGTLTYVPETGTADARKIDCQVSTVKPLRSAFPTDMQIVLLCSYPFWRAVNTSTELISGSIGMLEFPLELPAEPTFEFGKIKSGNSVIFDYNGTIATGFKAYIYSVDPISTLRIFNFYTKEFIEISGNYPANSDFLVSSETGNRRIYRKLSTEAEYEDITADVVWGSTFFQIKPGQNRLHVIIDSEIEKMNASVDFSMKFGGV